MKSNPIILIFSKLLSLIDIDSPYWRIIISLYSIFYIIILSVKFTTMTLDSATRFFIALLINIIRLSIISNSASVPVSWQRSTYFTSGQFVCIPPASDVTFTSSVTYSPALTGSPTKMPSLGITDINHQFTLPNVYMKFNISTFTQAGLTITANLTFGSSFAMKLSYLAPDPSMTYQYSSYITSTNTTKVGPFLDTQYIIANGLTNPSVGLDMSHELTMLPFINIFNITSSSYCFQLILKTKITDAKTYQVNVSSSCTGMVVSLVGWSRIIFDITAIEDLGYCYFQYGIYTALNNNGSTLNVLLNPFIAGNFLMGISQFKYTSPTAPIIMSFNTTLANLITTTTNTVFERLAFTYWSLKYRYCPPAYPYFHLPTEKCYDVCPAGTYYNIATVMCINCFYTCNTCSGYPACTDCNSTNNRHLNGTSCLPNAGYFDNGTAYAPPCTPHCIDCITLSVCTVCDTANGYYLVGSVCQYCNSTTDNFINMTNLQCEPCTLTACTDCYSLTICNTCNTTANYAIEGVVCDYCNNTLNEFINSTLLCENCSQPGCIACLSLTTCSLCNISESYYLANSTCRYCNSTNNFFINTTNVQCELCSLNQCIKCASLTQCSVCNTTANYYLLNQACEYCNNSLNNFINAINQCETCSIEGCITCSSLTTCTLCDTNNNYYTLGLICGYCNNTLNDFINSSLLCQHCTLTGCTTCQTLSICTVCNASDFYYLVAPICQYCNLSLNFYLTLNQSCQYCNNSLNNFINATNQCETCSIEGCITCSSLTTCSLCDTNNNYYTLGLVCGYCNNSLNYFINSSTLMCDLCTLSNCIVCNDLLTCSQCNQTAGFFPNSFSLCQPCQLQGCIQCSSLSTCKVCDSALQYSLSSSKTCNRCNGCKCYSQKLLPASVPSIQYSEQECRNFERMDSTLSAIAIASFSVMILASFTTCLIGIELIGVLQLAFLNMGDNLFVHLYLSPILGWSYVNGYNIKPTQFQAVPPNIEQIGYTNGFLDNVNVMFGVLLFSTILLILSEILARKFSLKFNRARKIIQQIYMGIYLFNSLNISFSLGLQYKYFRLEDMRLNMYIFSVVCSCLVIFLYLGAVLCLTFSKKLKCGEYTERFKGDFLNQLYIPITMLYRFALGIYMSVGNESDNTTLLILAISFTFILFNIINLSYNKFYHNYRANINHISQLVILMVTNYYRSMKKYYPMEVKAQINSPAIIQIVFIFLCIIAAALNGVYEGVIKIKTMRSFRKIENENMKLAQQSFQNTNLREIEQQQYEIRNKSQINHRFNIKTQLVD